LQVGVCQDRFTFHPQKMDRDMMSGVGGNDDSPYSCSSDDLDSDLAAMERLEDEGQLSLSLRKKAWALCKNYLHGEWANISHHDIIVRQLSGGLSNWMYLCSLPKGRKPAATGHEPSTVLLRLFGQKLPSSGSDEETTALIFNAHITDNVIFTLLSERRLGPRLYGIFAGGRLEEYIESESLVDFRICDTTYCAPIARIFAKIHMLNVPIKKDGADWLFSTLESWSEALSKVTPSDFSVGNGDGGGFGGGEGHDESLVREVMSYNYQAEINWLRQVLPQVNSPIVFCHNDLQGGNVLRRCGGGKSLKNEDDRLVAIDYEFCGYNYRAYDIANHWIEWMYDYGNKTYPYYYVDEAKFPTREQQVEFLRSYIREVQAANPHEVPVAKQLIPGSSRSNSSCKTAGLTVDQMVEVLLREIELFLAVPNLLWTLWSIERAVNSDIQFGYWHFAASHMEWYFKYKERMKSTLFLERNRKMSDESADATVTNNGKSDLDPTDAKRHHT